MRTNELQAILTCSREVRLFVKTAQFDDDLFFRSKGTEDGPGKAPDDERGVVVGVKSTANLVDCVAWCNERNSGAGELSVSCLFAADLPIEMRSFVTGWQLQGRVLDGTK
jgi:hypothetical protein